MPVTYVRGRSSAGSVTSLPPLNVMAYRLGRISNLSVSHQSGQCRKLTVGFVTNGSKLLLIVASGPALGSFFGINDFYADPRISGFRRDGQLVDANDNWLGPLTTTFANVGAFFWPLNSKDAAIVSAVNGPQTVQIDGTGSASCSRKCTMRILRVSPRV